jgi:hypothetical protein
MIHPSRFGGRMILPKKKAAPFGAAGHGLILV